MSNPDRAWTAEQVEEAAKQCTRFLGSRVETYAPMLRAYAATLRQQAERGDGAVSCIEPEELYEQLSPYAVPDCHDCGGRGVLYYGNVCVCGCVTSKLAPLLRAPAEQGGRVDRITKAPFYWEVGGGTKQDSATGYCNGWNACLAALAQNAQGDEFAAAAYAATGRGPLSDDEIEAEKRRVVTHAERARVPNREMANLLNRAAAALETPDDLDAADKAALIEDLVLAAAPSQPEDAA